MKILYVGLDALDIDVFTKDYPNFSKLRNSANWGTAIPEIAHTLPSWTSINTGMTVSQHGVRDSWEKASFGVHERLKGNYIWDYVHAAGLSCGVLSFPITFPPRQWDDGKSWFVSGFPAGRERAFYYPLSLWFPNGWYVDWVNFVKDKYPGRVPKGCPFKGMETVNKLKEFESLKYKFLRKAPKVDFLAVQCPIIDRIGHEMIKPEMQGEDQRAPLPFAWEFADDMLKWLIEYQQPDVILLASDHGIDCELHTFNGIWAIVGAGVAENVRIDIKNHRILPTFLDLLGLELKPYMGQSALVRAEDDNKIIAERLKALGYEE